MRKKKNTVTDTPTPQETEFIRHYFLGKSRRQAAIAAGYSVLNTNQTTRMFRRPRIQAAIKQIQEKVMADLAYDAKKAMQELEAAIEFAKSTDNATAYVRAVELRAKMHGLLVDKQQVEHSSGFSIRISGIDPPAPIDADFVELPPPAKQPSLADVFGDEVP